MKVGKFYVIHVDGRGLKVISGPHKDEIEANQFVKTEKDEIWTGKLCKRKGLI